MALSLIHPVSSPCLHVGESVFLLPRVLPLSQSCAYNGQAIAHSAHYNTNHSNTTLQRVQISHNKLSNIHLH